MTLSQMKFASALSTQTDLLDLVQDLSRQIRADFGAEKIDLVLLFAHPDVLRANAGLAETVRRGLGARHLVGCSGAAILGNHQECEQQPAVSVLAAQLPGVEVTPFSIDAETLADAAGPAFWHFQLDVAPELQPNLLVFLDPFSIPAAALVDVLGAAYPAMPLIGGLASGGRQPGDCRLFFDDETLEAGAVGVALSGNIELRALISQGCRPIGQPLTITRADKNVIIELGGRPPLAVLQELLPQLPAGDQKLAQTAVLLGRVINEYQEDFAQGDFLVRNLIGHDPASGALAIGDWVRTGQTVQFQVRDGATAAADLETLLLRERARVDRTKVRGALLVSCMGRGAGMYGAPNHDIEALQQVLGPLPVAGFFANGEIGPVGAKSFVHGFTSVIGLFAEARPKDIPQ